ncbi:MAG: trypsin-like peptidase domain-containing protein [Lachnospiraceae bacterium]|nr:trypsin-like peptidase domain-containing protein [Lachnospiraceae bacterium]
MYEDDNEIREERTENTPVVPRPHYTSYQYTGTPGAGVHIPEGPSIKEPPKKQNRKPGFFRKALVSVALGLIFGLCAGGAFYLVNVLTKTVADTQEVTSAETGNASVKSEVKTVENAGTTGRKVTTTTAGSSVSTVTDVTEVAADVTPAVVAITNDMVITGRTWFGQEIQQQSEASGSGIIVGENDDELLIVTNEHVVSDATTLSVQFVDGSVAEANFKGQDKNADIAVIAVNFDSLSENTIDAIKIATLGDSDKLSVGEPVIAIGNALGYGQSVTTGIVSALNRELELDNGTHELIQTDAAINPGNSGGALLNIDGELIGINEAKAGGNGIEGMGYAIPISTAKPIIEELMNKTTKKKAEEGKQAYLGIAGVAVAKDVASTYDMPEGIYLAQVEEGSAADEGGLKKGDIITKFDGQSVSSMEELKDLMEYYEAGDKVEITVQTQKDGGYAEEKHTVTLGAKSDT